MTKEELLKPRYKVIALYPGCYWKVGDIFEYENHNCFKAESQPSIPLHGSVFTEHPHLFKKLQWWEDRKPEEMPEFLIWVDNKIICKPKRYNGAYFYLSEDDNFRYQLCNTLPATEEEVNATYQSWLKEVKKEQKNYKLFKGVELSEAQLLALFEDAKTPIEALNDLATIC